jgi:hypothetical protein
LPPTHELYITGIPLAKLYSNNTGRLPIQAHSGNQYITISYHSQCNAILCAPYANRSDKHRLAAYNSIMHRLTNHGHNVNLQILYNKVSTEFKAAIEDLGCAFRWIPAGFRRRLAKSHRQEKMLKFKAPECAIILS